MQYQSKYIRRTAFVLIDKSKIWNAGGCHTYCIFNQSNVNVTIGNILVLRPGQYLQGPTENYDIRDWTDIDIQFDMANNPNVVQPDTGPFPAARSYYPGDPVPERDMRLIIIQSFLETNDKVNG